MSRSSARSRHPARAVPGDFGWKDQGVILEFDGRAKYFDYVPTEVDVFNERRREKALKAMGWEVERKLKAALGRPRRVLAQAV